MMMNDNEQKKKEKEKEKEKKKEKRKKRKTVIKIPKIRVVVIHKESRTWVLHVSRKSGTRHTDDDVCGTVIYARHIVNWTRALIRVHVAPQRKVDFVFIRKRFHVFT